MSRLRRAFGTPIPSKDPRYWVLLILFFTSVSGVPFREIRKRTFDRTLLLQKHPSDKVQLEYEMKNAEFALLIESLTVRLAPP